MDNFLVSCSFLPCRYIYSYTTLCNYPYWKRK